VGCGCEKKKKKKKKTRLYRAKVLIKENIRGESSIQQALGLL